MRLIANISPAKSGTSAVFHCLGRCADIARPVVKEPAFFSAATSADFGDLPPTLAPSGNFGLGEDWFDGLYPETDGKRYRLDFSTAYFVTPDTPRRLHVHDPQARLIFIFRDPVDRYVSHYHHLLKSGIALPPIGQAIAGDDAVSRFLLRHGDCARTLAAYREYFADNQICILKFDDLRDAPERIEAGLRHFLGVEDFEFRPSESEKLAAGHTRSRLIQAILYGPHIEYLSRFVRLFEALGLLRLRRRIMAWNTRKAGNPPLPDSDRARLQDRLAAQYEIYDRL